jgi:AraC-like DNA-binding protein
VLDFEDNGRIVIGEPPFRLAMSHAVLRDGVSLFTGGGCSPTGYTIAPSGEMPSRNLLIGCLLGGAGSLLADGNEKLDWRAPGQMYVVSLSERQLSYDIAAKADYNAVTMMLTPDALELIASEDGLPQVLVDVLEGRSEPVALSRPMPMMARRTAQELMAPLYQGRAAELYQEAKTLELLAHQTDLLVDAPVPRRELSTRELIRVREARERLVANLQEPPSLTDLAASVGLTPKRLNLGFRQLFGMTVFHYLMEERLVMARRLLDEGLDMPLKQLAWSVGYNQVSNFITAFRRRFGVSPGIYRRHADAEE